MPPRKRTSSVLNGDAKDHPIDDDSNPVDEVTTRDDALALADEAEAEAAEAEAVAAAARARARAIRLRRQAATAAEAATVAKPADVEEIEGTAAVELDEPTTPNVADDDTDIDSDADETDEKPARRRRLKRPGLKVLAAALVVVLSLGLLGASGWMIWQHRQTVAEQQRSAEFAAAARQGVVTLMSLNFSRAKEDVQRIIDNTTGDFKKDFEGQAGDFTKVAQDSKVITEATVNATAVQSMTRDTATVLIAVTTRVSNVASKEQAPRSWRLSVDVARDGGQIKLAKVEFVP
ncbi:MAG: Mce-associated rane protein [Mycobacterium sp.]|jgi:Mce-associated membrane protein|nr:Mce-associated rane protein [Mycobacterium sp.]MDT5303287.1 Mce-associated rane protein [Mycobacterium sp.]